jgi:hypothetical protein
MLLELPESGVQFRVQSRLGISAVSSCEKAPPSFDLRFAFLSFPTIIPKQQNKVTKKQNELGFWVLLGPMLGASGVSFFFFFFVCLFSFLLILAGLVWVGLLRRQTRQQTTSLQSSSFFFIFTFEIVLSRTPLIIRTVGLRARDFPTERVLSRTPLIIRTVDQEVPCSTVAIAS